MVVLCCATGALASEEQSDARLLEAQTAFDEAQRLKEAGRYTDAIKESEHALALRGAVRGATSPEVATSLNQLGDLFRRQGDVSRAEPLLQRALAIREATLGQNHPDVATSLNCLAILYLDQGQYARAETLYQRALVIWESALGQGHPDVATSLHNLANLYRDQGKHARAEPLFQRALAIFEAALGQSHPDIAESLDEFALNQLALHGPAHAVPLLTRAFIISEGRLRQESLGFSESRLTDFLQHLRTEEERLYSLLRAHPENSSVRHLAATAVLLRKGRSVEEIANTSRAVYRSLGARERDTFERLRDLRTQLAQLSLSGPGSLAPADYQQRLKALADEGDSLEADLARHSAPLREQTARPPPAEIVDRVAASLPGNAALIEFIAYEDSPLLPPPGTPRSRIPTQLRYLALVLFPDARIHAVDLGPAAPIDRAAAHLRNAMARRDANYQRVAQELYTLAFKPLLPGLGEVRRLFLSPDGQLGLVPFAALHDGHGFLVDSFDFSYVTSGKDLLPRPQQLSPARSVVVLADPDFGARLEDATPESQRSPSLERFFSTRRRDLSGGAWAPLPGTRREGEAIQSLLPQAQLHLGPEATKQRLLQLSTPGVLHVATHGFFLEDSVAPKDSRGLGHSGGFSSDAAPPRPADPLLRSGLVLSGAKAPGKDAATAEDALVTALELAGLDLWGTQLVVLSACDTGRGDVKHGQGVYGLRRALVIAGAETVVMSLWKVNDDSTRLLMEDYYRHLLAGGGRAEALRDAMRTLRESRPHPHYWAPFIALGRDAPLQSIAPVLPPR
ncbi:CHAT domain-containing protein [Myxococcus sp. RHSTA-1-4]|uniref:CHAT domain-containing protein n=1 Tax=Myxococcus sp. RHSTA-1-4 TaxID=2874601 RepID=UPI00351D573A